MEEQADELLIDILLRLPLFRALKSQLVCKRWYGLISSSIFDQLFASKKHDFALFIQHSDSGGCFGNAMVVEGSPCPELKSMCNGRGLSLDFLPREYRKKLPIVIASGDDLLLCENFYDRGEDNYVVCNPVNEKWVQLPPPPAPTLARPGTGTAGLRRYQALSIRNRSNYTVISIPFLSTYMLDSKTLSKLTIQTFSFESFEWTEKIVPNCPTLTPMYQNHGVLCNRLLFWMLFLESDRKIRRSLMALDPFDLEKRPHFFNFPTDCRGDIRQVLGTSMGRLRLLQLLQLSKDPNLSTHPWLRVWDLKHYEHHDKHEWFLYCKISLGDMEFCPPLLAPNINPRYPSGLICCHPDDPDVVYIKAYGQLASCNLLQRKLRQLCPISPYWIVVISAFPYFLPWKPTPVI